MHRFYVPILIALATPPLVAQNCPSAALGSAVGTGDDVMLPIRPIGFVFPFAGSTFTDVHICTNGYFHLSNAGVPAPGGGDGTATTAELVAGSPRICALWTDLNIIAANGANVLINSTPAQCTITWDKAVTYGSTTPIFNVQAQLFPSGEVKFFYGPGATNNSTASALYAVGITGACIGGAAILPAASDLSAGGVTPDNTIFEIWPVANTFDMAAQAEHMIATSPGWVYMNGVTANCASTSNYGTGCLDAAGVPNSYYELLPALSFDLSGVVLTNLRTPTGYIVLNSLPGAIVPPSGSATVIADADDTVQTVSLSAPMPVPGGVTSSLTVCSNGNIALSAMGNGTAYTPSVVAFLAWPETAFAAWHDYNPIIAGSGKIKFEQVAGFAYVTWDGVYSYATTQPNTLQFQFNLATGDVTIVFGTYATVGNDHLVGYSVAGASADPGPTDLSSAFGTLTIQDDKKALAL
ncbi:MAG TPA: hypothetical protein VFT55_11370, partial [Planctomycetota bacterium]|nr:hypothetical protein [Planctomycetota bacterium]